jgi:WD40 repeat protein
VVVSPLAESQVIVGDTAGGIARFDMESGKVSGVLDEAKAAITQLVCHPTIPILFAASADTTVKLYDLRSVRCLYILASYSGIAPCSSLPVCVIMILEFTGARDSSAHRLCVVYESR